MAADSPPNSRGERMPFDGFMVLKRDQPDDNATEETVEVLFCFDIEQIIAGGVPVVPTPSLDPITGLYFFDEVTAAMIEGGKPGLIAAFNAGEASWKRFRIRAPLNAVGEALRTVIQAQWNILEAANARDEQKDRFRHAATWYDAT